MKQLSRICLLGLCGTSKLALFLDRLDVAMTGADKTFTKFSAGALAILPGLKRLPTLTLRDTHDRRPKTRHIASATGVKPRRLGARASIVKKSPGDDRSEANLRSRKISRPQSRKRVDGRRYCGLSRWSPGNDFDPLSSFRSPIMSVAQETTVSPIDRTR